MEHSFPGFDGPMTWINCPYHLRTSDCLSTDALLLWGLIISFLFASGTLCFGILYFLIFFKKCCNSLCHLTDNKSKTVVLLIVSILVFVYFGTKHINSGLVTWSAFHAGEVIISMISLICFGADYLWIQGIDIFDFLVLVALPISGHCLTGQMFITASYKLIFCLTAIADDNYK